MYHPLLKVFLKRICFIHNQDRPMKFNNRSSFHLSRLIQDQQRNC